MNGLMSLLVYPAKDMASAKTLFKALLGIEPYVGGQTVQDVKDVGVGLLIATVKDAAGNTIGLRQPPR
jgi:hypothetical protein